MTTRTHTTKNGTIFEWEETKEVKKALDSYYTGNYNGPLYAPHPDLKDGTKTD